MVKADVKRDYYADLELPANADTEEIKRQFRLLGEEPDLLHYRID
jgi:curved DNA-binding protein CbpA